MNKIHVFFSVYEFGHDPQVVTDLMGIEPTRAWSQGELHGPRDTPRKDSRWQLHSPVERSEPIDEQLRALLPLLEARALSVAAVVHRFGAGIQCAAYFSEVNPGFHLDAALLERIVALGLDLDFDLYCLGED